MSDVGKRHLGSYLYSKQEDGSYEFVEQRADGNKFTIEPEDGDTESDILDAAKLHILGLEEESTLSIPGLAKRVKALEEEVAELKKDRRY
jgi:hypothetical protein